MYFIFVILFLFERQGVALFSSEKDWIDGTTFDNTKWWIPYLEYLE